MLKKRTLTLTNLTTQALEAAREALEVLFGRRIHFWQLDIDPVHESANMARVEIQARFTPTERTNEFSLSMFLEMKRENPPGNWSPERADIIVSFGSKSYSARWELRIHDEGVGVAVLITTSCGQPGKKYHTVGFSDTKRWNEFI